jgi:uncharacterized protein DUF4139/uncharacterized protein DUF4140
VITAVTVFEDRAAITRKEAFALAAGQQRVTVERVAPVLADKTLVAAIASRDSLPASSAAEGRRGSIAPGGARVLDIRCERYLAPWRDPAAGAAELPAQLREERARLAAEHDAAAARAQTAHDEAGALGELAAATLADLATAAARGTRPEVGAVQLAELDAGEAAARARALDAEQAARDAAAAIARLDERIARAEATAGEAAARLVIDVVTEQPADVVVTVHYVVPGAAWRPYHRAALAGRRIEWETTACVWQATGEDWPDVALTCSLERPSLGVEPPQLADDVLRARRRPEQIAVEAREQERQTTGLGGGASSEVPGIDDGGLGLVLGAPKATVRCDGRPHRVPVGEFVADAQVALVAIPLRSPWVHRRARLANAGERPLLAGPVDLIMASGYVGRAELAGVVAAGERFDVGFGPDSDVRVHRTETRERDDAGLLGGWNVQTVRVAVRLSNLGGEARTVEVTERVPVSEIEQVEVVVAAPDAYRLDERAEIPQVTARAIDDRGMVTWTVELPPFGRRAVALEYRVKSQRSVAI